MTDSELYAITVNLKEYDPEWDPDETEEMWKRAPHRRLVITAPLDNAEGYAPQAVRASRRYCSSVLARVAISLAHSIDFAYTHEDYEHRCTRGYRFDDLCGLTYEEGVVHVWDDGSPLVEFTVPTEYRTMWLNHARKVVAETCAADLKVSKPDKDVAAPLSTHTGITIQGSTDEKANRP